MDRNSLIGMGLIAIVLGVWMWMSAPTKEEMEKNKRIQDSIAKIENTNTIASNHHNIHENQTHSPRLVSKDTLPDSIKIALKKNYYKDFLPYTEGKTEFFTIENDILKITFKNPGARLVQAELKNYHRFGENPPLALLDADSTLFRFIFNAYDRTRIFFSDSLYFIPEVSSKNKISFYLKFPESAFFAIHYSLPPDSYSMTCTIETQNAASFLSSTEDQLNFQFTATLPGIEKHIVKEKEVATIYYKYKNSSPDYLNPGSESEEPIHDDDIHWVAFKHQFFNITLLSDSAFPRSGSKISLSPRTECSTHIKKMTAELGIPLKHEGSHQWNFSFLFAPNHYYTLKKVGYDLERMIPLGWSVFSYLNKWLVIPLFNGLSHLNMGIVILILSIIMKLLLLPIAWKTYMSSMKMKALQPELNEINKKWENKDPLKKQQEQMQLYQRAGVSPFSGCIPLLIQLPILIALFSFVPAAFELRQKSFLWAEDLSTYDSIWDFGYVPFINWVYGDHVSLFALMMFVSTLIYTYMNSNMMPQQNEQMPGMKFMMYFMPVIFLAVMNRYSAGLSWYYFLANILSFLQNWIFKKLTDEKKIRLQLEANMKKPLKKSSFQKRLEEMARQRQQSMKAGKK